MAHDHHNSKKRNVDKWEKMRKARRAILDWHNELIEARVPSDCAKVLLEARKETDFEFLVHAVDCFVQRGAKKIDVKRSNRQRKKTAGLAVFIYIPEELCIATLPDFGSLKIKIINREREVLR